MHEIALWTRRWACLVLAFGAVWAAASVAARVLDSHDGSKVL